MNSVLCRTMVSRNPNHKKLKPETDDQKTITFHHLTDIQQLTAHRQPSKMGKNKSKNKRQHKETAPASDTAVVATPSQNDSKGSKRSKRKDNPPPSNSAKKNTLLKQQQAFLATLNRVERDSFFSNTAVDPERRAALWMEQADLGENLVNKFAWATPDERALSILKHFGPLVEVGCGRNAYWCRQMAQAGIDIVGYDVSPDQGGTINGSGNKQTDFAVRQGGPEVLALPENATRALFLCYPDESDDVVVPTEEGDGEDGDGGLPISMGAACLEYFQGDHVVHVGELFSDSNLSMEQAPWGRSSSPEFQQHLAAEFHCLLRVSLPNWLHVRDSISVWKRSETCTIVFAAEEAEEDEEKEEDEEVQYRHIPVEERLPADVAAPCLEHLLRGSLAAAEQKGEPRDKKAATGSKSDSKAVSSKETVSEDDPGYECPW
jgi:hypothetical protein